jgi:hypothetical protein
MTILVNQNSPDFDEDPIYQEPDRAQPITIYCGNDFIVLTQQDGTGECEHCILVEFRDVPALIDALRDLT